MKNLPILPALDLWALGHSASQIAEMLGFPNHRHVTKIVAQARSIGDKRAVFHETGGRLIGKGIVHRNRHPHCQIVPALGKPLCKRGHSMANKAANGGCRTCQNARQALWSAIKRRKQRLSPEDEAYLFAIGHLPEDF